MHEKLMPAVFFGHGSPMNAIESNSYTKMWIKTITETLTPKIAKPKAIISISSHWETDGTKITSNAKQRTIHDFYGFPQELYQVQYNPSGSVELANEICKKIPEISTDNTWGLDHGTWSVLRHLYPAADVATLQISIDKNKTPQEHYDFAKKLSYLRKEGFLVIANGNIVHNLYEINWRAKSPHPWAMDFSKSITNAIVSGDFKQVVNYKQILNWQRSVPTPEHFVPLLYILGLKQQDDNLHLFNQSIELGSIDMTCLAVK